MKIDQINLLRQYSRQLIRELGILEINKDDDKATPQRWHCLIEIANMPGITVLRLAHNLVLHKSTISRIVSELLDEKLITIINNEDERKKALTITKKGEIELKKIDQFSHEKILNAFRFLGQKDQIQIVEAIKKYSEALTKARIKNEVQKVQILKISTSRTLRLKVKSMIENIQENEFAIKIDKSLNDSVIKIEENFYFNNSYNFWYAIDENGEIIGSIGLKKIDRYNGEIKKFFVHKKWRGKKISQNLMLKLLKEAQKHRFTNVYLGTADVLKVAVNFYQKYGFKLITKKSLPQNYEICPVDNLFFTGKTVQILQNIKSELEC